MIFIYRKGLKDKYRDIEICKYAEIESESAGAEGMNKINFNRINKNLF